MSLLRIRPPVATSPERWEWALVEHGRDPVTGEGGLSQLQPHLVKSAERIELVLAASQALFTRANLPPSSARRSASMLAYAIEESIATEPDSNEVSWLGTVEDDADVVSVLDRAESAAWHKALVQVGVEDYAVCCETLMVPLPSSGWSCAWNGVEGFVRSGKFEGAATDCGDRQTPPLSLALMIEEAKSRDRAPASIVIHPTTPEAIPDVEAWQRTLGVKILAGRRWDWKYAPADSAVQLAQTSRQWRIAPETLARLRPVAWVAGVALAIHAVALIVDWTRLANEQQNLRARMETRFRGIFPEALAVADPALQMRRKLAEARRAANKPDDGDFTVMIGKVAGAFRDLPAGALQSVSYESGRMTLELATGEEALIRRLVANLTHVGFVVESTPLRRAARDKATLTLRAT